MNKKIVAISAVVLAIIAIIAIVFGIRSRTMAKQPYNYKDLSKYVTVGDYKNLPYYTTKSEVTDEEVEQEIQQRLAAAAKTKTVKKGEVKDGDTINIAYTGKIDGKEFDGGSSDSFDLTVGTTEMIDGFVEGLVGKKIGDKVTLNLTFPENYFNADVAGKPVVFDVTINYKSVTKTPKLDESFVKDNSDVKTVKEYKKSVRKELKKAKDDQFLNLMKQELWGYITSMSKVKKYPEKEMASAMKSADDIEQKYRAQAQQSGMEWADYLSQYMGTDEKAFQELKTNYAEGTVRDELTMYAIGRKEGVKFSDREYKKSLADLLETYHYTEQSFADQMGMTIDEYAETNNLRRSFYLDKVLDKVMEQGKKVSKKEYDAAVAKRTPQQSQAEGTSGTADATSASGQEG